LPLITATTKR